MGVMRLCFLLFCLCSAHASSVRKLNDIEDLKNAEYGNSPPHHGLQLLFWFAQNVLNVDKSNSLILDSNFDPHRGDFGFHLYENREAVLPSLSSWQSYYSVGNLSYPAANALPSYVRRYYKNTNVPERNIDRLIVSVDENMPNRIFKVFITTHNQGKNDFNPSETYEIDSALILEIRYPLDCKLHEKKNKIYYTYKISQYTEDMEDDRCSQFLKQIGYKSIDCTYISRRKKRSLNSQCNTFEGIKLVIKATKRGSAKLTWEIPADIMKKNKNVVVYIDTWQNSHSSDSKKKFTLYDLSGDLETSVSLNAGLQPRLQFFNYFGKPVTWYGPEFDGTNRVIPIRIKGVDASLQLYTEDGKACARLYIKKTFSNWKDVLYYSWVGFYKSSQHEHYDYYTYQYAVKFEKVQGHNTKKYGIYQYKSNLAIAPGVQIRLQNRNYNNVLAHTSSWEDDKEITILPSKICKSIPGHKPELPLPWSEPVYFYGSEFYDANKEFPTAISNFDASLQLFTKDGKAYAKLYIKNTFCDWEDAFYYAWVGFYKSSEDGNDDYYTYQYAVKFEKVEAKSTKDYDVYQYKSKLAIAPGVQIRLLLNKHFDKVLAKTKPW
ncbi:uncharacterized protein [Sinocyclocheilus grahami]|uniref:uncharacterized protein n=1 Tax=Sinocyclocheilus grahami TaxID=75366 RepID=UPI0007AD2CFC|nr:PREDICTED: uncharacterized protein LOC107600101 [Sinocyclocheilus grahami]